MSLIPRFRRIEIAYWGLLREEWEGNLEITSHWVDQKLSRVVIGCRVAVPRSHWLAVPTPLFDNTAAC